MAIAGGEARPYRVRVIAARVSATLALTLSIVLAACEVAPRPRPGGLSSRISGVDPYTETSRRLHERALAHHQEQVRRVERVGRRLLETIPSHPKVQFVIVNGDQSVNAGATFGQVAVTSGMLKFAETDDELAVVLGHELAHITEGHVMKGVMSGLALNVLAIVLETQVPGAGRAAGGIGQLFLNRYSQGQEHGADEVGLRYAYEAGYDPRAATDVHERLAVEVPQSMASGYFNSHPSSVERAVTTRTRAEELMARGEPPGRAEVLAMERADRAELRRARSRSIESRDLDADENAEARDLSFRTEPKTRPPPEEPSSEDCRRASVYAEMAKNARDHSERQDLYRRALRYCPTLEEAAAELRREPDDRE
ncbi:MAG: M48 family metallopeptidase [Candidatus Binatia bacterium]